jgi:hypothetical protein
MIGNAFQLGIPDLYCHHRKWGARWIDVKNSERYSFTKAQRLKWPVWERFNCGIWILTDATQAEYNKLFEPPNWRQYWKSSYGVPDVDKLLDELIAEDQCSTQLRSSTARRLAHKSSWALSGAWPRLV